MTDNADIIFYHRVPSRAQVVRWMLEELGEPYETRVLDFDNDEQHGDAFLALNPMGKVPTIVHKGAPVSEVAAICCYLADAYSDAGLNVPISDSARGLYLKWLFFGPSCIEPAIFEHMMPREGTTPMSLGWGSYDMVLNVLEGAVEPGPYLMGDHFTAADIVIGSDLRWAGWMNVLPDRPVLKAYVARLEERTALKRADALDNEISTA